MSFSNNLRHYRTTFKLTVAQLAEYSNLSDNHIRQLEKGEKSPTLDSLIAISNALDITPDCLITGVSPNIPTTLQSLSKIDICTLTDQQVHFLSHVINETTHHIDGIYEHE